MPVPTIKDLFNPINSISTCINMQGQTISKGLSDINNTIIGAATSFSNTAAAFKETLEKAKDDIVKSINGVGNVGSKKGKKQNGITAKNIEKLSKEISTGIATGMVAVSTSVSATTSAIHETGNLVAQTNAILTDISTTLKKTRIDNLRANRREAKKEKANAVKGGTIDLGSIKGTDSIGKGIQDIARAVMLIGDISVKDTLVFKRKLKHLMGGVANAVTLYNEAVDGIDVKETAESMSTLGEGLSDFVSKVSDVTGAAAITSKLMGGKRGALYKTVRNATYAVLVGLYGAKYDKKTGSYSDFNEETPEMLAKGGDVLNELGSNILKFNAKMALAAPLSVVALGGAALFRLEVPLIRSAINAIFDKKGDIKADEQKYIAAGRILDKVGTSILMFNAKLALSTVLAPVAMVGMGLFGLLMLETSAVFNYLNRKDVKAKLLGGEYTLNKMAGSILGFEAYMVLSLVLAPVAAIGLAISTPLVMGTYGLFRKLGSKTSTKRVRAASLSIALMGASMITFSLSMLATTMITRKILTGGNNKIDPEDLTALATTVPMFGLMIGANYLFNTMGKPQTLKSSALTFLSVTLMSASLVVFSLGMLAATKITKNMWRNENGDVDPMSIITSVSVFGLMFGGLALFNMAGKNIVGVGKGFAAIAAMSVGIGIFGYGLKFYAESIRGLNQKDLIIMPVLLGGFALEFGAMGAASEFILLGSASAAAMGVGVGVFGFGLSTYLESMNGIAFTDAMKSAGILGVYGAEFALLGLASPAIAGAGAATAIIGAGLIELGKGLSAWNKVADNIDDTTLEKLAKTIDLVKLAFMGNVDENGKPKKSKLGTVGGLLKGVVGTIAAPFDLVVMGKTAAGISMASKSMRELAIGLKVWESMQVGEDTVKGFSKTMILLNEAFGSMAGKSNSSKTSVLKVITGIDLSAFSPTDVELGIRSTKNMGKALTNIAEGVVKFRDGIGKEFTDETKATELATAITNVITPIANAFAAIGNNEAVIKRQKGLFAKMFNTLMGELASPASKTAVNVGIKSTRELGKTLRNIAEGTKEFATMIPKNAKASWLADVGDNIAAVLTSVIGPFAALDKNIDESTITATSKKVGNSMAEVYKSMNNVRTITKQSDSVKAGVEAVKGLGTTLKGIADATKTFSEVSKAKLGKSGTWDENWNITDEGSGALGAITQVMCGQFALFAKLGKTVKETGTYEDVKKEGNWFNRTKTKTAKSYIGLAVDSMANLGQVINGIGEGLTKFNNPEWKTDAITGASLAFRTITAFMESFGTLGFALTSEDINKRYYAIDSGSWDKETVEKFGTVSGRISKIRTASDDIAKGVNTVQSTIENFNKAMKGIKDNSENLKYVFETPEHFMYPMYNVLETCRMLTTGGGASDIGMLVKGHRLKMLTNEPILGDTTLKDASKNIGEIKSITKKIRESIDNISIKESTPEDISKGTVELIKSINKIGKNKLTDNTYQNVARLKLTANILSATFDEIGSAKMAMKTSRSEKTAEKMNNAITNLSTGIGKIENMKPNATNAFPKLINSINKSLTVLDGKGGKLKQATNLVDKLIKAKKANVFDNMASNTRNIASAINSLNNTNMKPYAEMIAALGKLSERDSKYKELFQDLINLLKDLNKELAKSNQQQQTVPPGLQGIFGENKGNQPRIPYAQNQPQQPARQTQTVATDYTSKLDEIWQKLNEINTSVKDLKIG